MIWPSELARTEIDVGVDERLIELGAAPPAGRSGAGVDDELL
jgi:hypothetical protein